MASINADRPGRFKFRYARRLNHVLNFAHENWNNDLNLNVLADTACLSKYHFAKLFHDYAGEPPISFIKRIRLESSAHMLCYRRELSISDIALSSGFSSHQTFSRSFAGKFGNSPREFRSIYAENLESALESNKANRYASSSNCIQGETGFSGDQPQIKLAYRAPVQVAYFRNIGAYGISTGIDRAIASIRQWAKQNGLWGLKSRIIGASWDNNRITPNTFCKYDACIQLPGNYSVKDEISVQTLPGGLYAVLRTPYRNSGEIALLWRSFTRHLRHSPRFRDYRMRSTPCFEVFGENQTNGESEVELNIKLLR